MHPETLVLFGPTACGKTAVAVALAERIGAEVVSMDSMAVYRGMDAGTAKPTAAERARVRHHCVDVADPTEPYDVGRWTTDAGAALRDLAARGRRAIVCGGTGLYLRACERGLAPAPPRDAAVRAELLARAEREGAPALHAALAAVDPAAAARLHPHDVRRVTRALEVHACSGRPLSAWHADTRPLCPGARVVWLRRDDADLRARIAARTAAMWRGSLRGGGSDADLPPLPEGGPHRAAPRASPAEGGPCATEARERGSAAERHRRGEGSEADLPPLLNECRRLRAAGWPLAPEPAGAVGYREAFAVLDGALDADAARALTERRTWRLTRRQATWGRSLAAPLVVDLPPDEPPEQTAARIA